MLVMAFAITIRASETIIAMAAHYFIYISGVASEKIKMAIIKAL